MRHLRFLAAGGDTEPIDITGGCQFTADFDTGFKTDRQEEIRRVDLKADIKIASATFLISAAISQDDANTVIQATTVFVGTFVV